jgi:hypothetical protein
LSSPNEAHEKREGEGVPTTTLYAMPMIKTSILFLNDCRCEVRTACERIPTRETPTANTNTNQANILRTPVKSFLMRCNIDIQIGRDALALGVMHSATTSDMVTIIKCKACRNDRSSHNLIQRLGFTRD